MHHNIQGMGQVLLAPRYLILGRLLSREMRKKTCLIAAAGVTMITMAMVPLHRHLLRKSVQMDLMSSDRAIYLRRTPHPNIPLWSPYHLLLTVKGRKFSIRFLSLCIQSVHDFCRRGLILCLLVLRQTQDVLVYLVPVIVTLALECQPIHAPTSLPRIFLSVGTAPLDLPTTTEAL